MHARVARFEGAEPEKLRETVGQIHEQAASGPPEGVPAKSFLMLTNPDDGKTLAITLFETEADMKQGDEVLSAMDPPVTSGMGRRASVEMYEVSLQMEA